jgi:hypothetical protein
MATNGVTGDSQGSGEAMATIEQRNCVMLGIKATRERFLRGDEGEAWVSTLRGRDDLNLRFSESGRHIIAAVLYSLEGRFPWYSEYYTQNLFTKDAGV